MIHSGTITLDLTSYEARAGLHRQIGDDPVDSTPWMSRWTFPETFPSPPRMLLGLVGMASGSQSELSFDLALDAVTTTSFTLRLTVDGDPNPHATSPTRLTFSWLAITA